MSAELERRLTELVARAQVVVAHAWVVRAFIRHSPEVEDYPELHEIGRAIFDLARALETRVDDARGYFKMLGKKHAKYRTAVNEFCRVAPSISSHTNYAMATISLADTVTELQSLVEASQQAIRESA
ncbi:MAG: amidohydrolase [Planctomycetaceae bacterium]|nr:amidohydrolase [Planctomycetaceae bacterium]